MYIIYHNIKYKHERRKTIGIYIYNILCECRYCVKKITVIYHGYVNSIKPFRQNISKHHLRLI